MAITVKLKGSAVTIDPMSHPMNYGNGDIDWKQKDDSDEYNFDDPPIIFDSSSAPITIGTPNGADASGTDNNQNNSGQDVGYTYHVCLIDANGNHITYPPMNSPANDPNPTITNKPR